MRHKKENLLEYSLKKEMLQKSLSIIFPEIIQKSKKVNAKTPLFLVYADLITLVKKFKENDELEYAMGFYFCLILGEDYNKIIKNEILLESTIAAMLNEKNWDTGDLPYDVCIYFSYTFLNELFKDISIDIHLLNKAPNTLEYLKNLRNEII
jgi:hypothetical protein